MENLLLDIINTSLFSLLVLINIILCFTFGNYTLKRIIPSTFYYDISDKKIEANKISKIFKKFLV